MQGGLRGDSCLRGLRGCAARAVHCRPLCRRGSFGSQPLRVHMPRLRHPPSERGVPGCGGLGEEARDAGVRRGGAPRPAGQADQAILESFWGGRYEEPIRGGEGEGGGATAFTVRVEGYTCRTGGAGLFGSTWVDTTSAGTSVTSCCGGRVEAAHRGDGGPHVGSKAAAGGAQ